MSEFKCNDGPLRIHKRPNGFSYWLLTEKDLCLAEVYDGPHIYDVHGPGNARVFAHAPDMLKLLDRSLTGIRVLRALLSKIQMQSGTAVAEELIADTEALLSKIRDTGAIVEFKGKQL